LISDPGTGSYYGHPDWRQVMRGTRAHATVCVDDQDQSVIGGSFLWSRHAKVNVRGVDLHVGVVDAEHDGYTRLSGSVTHRRWLIAPEPDTKQLVIDQLTGKGIHHFSQNWPLHPDLDAAPIPSGHFSSVDGVRLTILYAASCPLSTSQIKGDSVNNLGWWSDCLESRKPAWWLAATGQARLPVVIATLLSSAEASLDAMSVQLLGNRIVASWSENGVGQSVVVDTSRSASVSFQRSKDGA